MAVSLRALNFIATQLASICEELELGKFRVGQVCQRIWLCSHIHEQRAHVHTYVRDFATVPVADNSLGNFLDDLPNNAAQLQLQFCILYHSIFHTHLHCHLHTSRSRWLLLLIARVCCVANGRAASIPCTERNYWVFATASLFRWQL